MDISIPISIGELCDKVSILEIKRENIADTTKLEHINFELSSLREILVQQSVVDDPLFFKLKAINQKLWETEDDIRECEREKDFGTKFIELARNVYHFNDERFRIKSEINKKHRSTIFEEKSYKQY